MVRPIVQAHLRRGRGGAAGATTRPGGAEVPRPPPCAPLRRSGVPCTSISIAAVAISIVSIVLSFRPGRLRPSRPSRPSSAKIWADLSRTCQTLSEQAFSLSGRLAGNTRRLRHLRKRLGKAAGDAGQGVVDGHGHLRETRQQSMAGVWPIGVGATLCASSVRADVGSSLCLPLCRALREPDTHPDRTTAEPAELVFAFVPSSARADVERRRPRPAFSGNLSACDVWPAPPSALSTSNASARRLSCRLMLWMVWSSPLGAALLRRPHGCRPRFRRRRAPAMGLRYGRPRWGLLYGACCAPPLTPIV